MSISKELGHQKQDGKKLNRRKSAVIAAASLLVGTMPAGNSHADNNLAKTVDKPATATAKAERLSKYLVGDSIMWDECALLPGYTCNAYPGGWTSGPEGKNLLADFVAKSPIKKGDTVILSNISAWLYPELGITNEVVLDRLQDQYEIITSAGAELVVVTAPQPTFPLCTGPYESLSAEQQSFGGKKEHWDEACKTQDAIAELQRSWDYAYQVDMPGPFNPSDGIHLTQEGKANLANMILSGEANGWDTVADFSPER